MSFKFNPFTGRLDIASGDITTDTPTTFTQGSIIFAGTDGTLQEDNASLFWNDSFNRLGVGTTTPDATIEAETFFSTAGKFSSNSYAAYLADYAGASGENAAGVFLDGTTITSIGVGAGTGIQTDGELVLDGGGLDLNAGAGGRIYNDTGDIKIDSQYYGTGDLILNPLGGDVGIGVLAPSYILDILGGTSNQMRVKDGAGSELFIISAEASAPTGFIEMGDVGIADLGTRFRIDLANDRIYATNGVDNVSFGINTSTPGANLDVKGSIRSSRDDSTNYVEFSSVTATANFPRGGFLLGDSDNNFTNGAIWAAPAGTNQITTTLEALTNSDTSTNSTKRIGIRATTSENILYSARGVGNDGDVPLSVYPNGLSGSAAMTFETDGKVGIGTTSPDELLHLEATAATSTREVLMKCTVSDGGNDQFGVANGSSVDGRFIPAFFGYQDSTNTLYSLNMRGLVSSGNDTSDSSGRGIVHIEAYRTSSATDPNNGTLTNVQNRKIFTVWNGGTDIMSVMPDGRVGIGTNSFDGSSAGLEIRPTARGKWGCLVTDTDGGRGAGMYLGAQGQGAFYVYTDAAGNVLNHRLYGSDHFSSYICGIEGDLGVGTQSPVRGFDFGGHNTSPIHTNTEFLISQNTNNIAGVEMFNASTGASAEFRFLIKDTTGMYFAFTVPSTGNTGTLYERTRSGVGYIFTSGGTARHISIGPNSARDIALCTNAAERMTIKSNGPVIIGRDPIVNDVEVYGHTDFPNFIVSDREGAINGNMTVDSTSTSMTAAFFSDATDRNRLVMGNMNGSNDSSAIMFIHNSGVASGGQPVTLSADWELGNDYNKDKSHNFYMWDSQGGEYVYKVESDRKFQITSTAYFNLEEKTSTPTNPDAGAEANIYMKADKLIVQYNDAGTMRYKYLDLTGTGATWTYSATAP